MAIARAPQKETGRLTSAARREQILAAAGRALSDQGYLPLPYEQIAREAGASKALIYSHFATQAALCNALIERALYPLAERIARVKPQDFGAWACACAAIYFDTVADLGGLLNLLFTDPYLDGAREPGPVNRRDALWRDMIRRSRPYVDLPVRERIAALAMILAIPEEMGRLVHRGDVRRDRGRALCEQLVVSSLKGLKEAGGPPR